MVLNHQISYKQPPGTGDIDNGYTHKPSTETTPLRCSQSPAESTQLLRSTGRKNTVAQLLTESTPLLSCLLAERTLLHSRRHNQHNCSGLTGWKNTVARLLTESTPLLCCLLITSQVNWQEEHCRSAADRINTTTQLLAGRKNTVCTAAGRINTNDQVCWQENHCCSAADRINTTTQWLCWQVEHCCTAVSPLPVTVQKHLKIYGARCANSMYFGHRNTPILLPSLLQTLCCSFIMCKFIGNMIATAYM